LTGRLSIFLFLLIFTSGLAHDVWALSVEGAYQAIPHRRTVFDPGNASMSAEERDYLVRLFDLVDEAVVERVRLLQRFSSGMNSAAQAGNNYGSILDRLNDLSVPDGLGEVHDLVVAAVQDQSDFFDAWSEVYPEPLDVRSHELSQSASQELQQAYGLLMEIYPQESGHNKNAFYDYLCALDFL